MLVYEENMGGWERDVRVPVDALGVGDGARVEGRGLPHGEDFKVRLRDGEAWVFGVGGGEHGEGWDEEGEEGGEVHLGGCACVCVLVCRLV